MEYIKVMMLAIVVLFLTVYFMLEIRHEKLRKTVKIGSKVYYYHNNKRVKGIVESVSKCTIQSIENNTIINREYVTFIRVNGIIIHVQNIYKL